MTEPALNRIRIRVTRSEGRSVKLKNLLLL